MLRWKVDSAVDFATEHFQVQACLTVWRLVMQAAANQVLLLLRMMMASLNSSGGLVLKLVGPVLLAALAGNCRCGHCCIVAMSVSELGNRDEDALPVRFCIHCSSWLGGLHTSSVDASLDSAGSLPWASDAISDLDCEMVMTPQML